MTRITMNNRCFGCSCGYEYHYTSQDKNDKKFNLIKRMHYKKCDGVCITVGAIENIKIKQRSIASNKKNLFSDVKKYGSMAHKNLEEQNKE